ncbi:MAG TPA: hypothetical protein VJM31_15120 [Vicinamibacterales bacterium]|nr:hypothetical protein [Vicinamibacterales bacterium]
MRRAGRLLGTLFVLGFNSSAAFASPVLTEAVIFAMPHSNIETGPIQLSLRLSADVSVAASVSITSKGNGVLDLPGAKVRLYDRHEDTVTFAEGLLNNELVDIDGDGLKDLVLWGTAVETDDKGTSEIERRPVLCIFKYDPHKSIFINTVPSKDVSVY